MTIEIPEGCVLWKDSGKEESILQEAEKYYLHLKVRITTQKGESTPFDDYEYYDVYDRSEHDYSFNPEYILVKDGKFAGVLLGHRNERYPVLPGKDDTFARFGEGYLDAHYPDLRDVEYDVYASLLKKAGAGELTLEEMIPYKDSTCYGAHQWHIGEILPALVNYGEPEYRSYWRN